jgi:hypothetical protein
VAEALKAEVMAYDGAWLFVRKARKPLYEGLVCKVYFFGSSDQEGGGFGPGRFLDFALRRIREEGLPQGLPYAVQRVGDRLLACAPAETHERLEGITRWRAPGSDDDDDHRGWGPPPGWGRGRPGRGGRGR